ncbi:MULTISPECIES: MarR family winged helix-turn-helix transcriptional regulator [Rhizobium/Agrobacterium group]|jgi:MarR family transcriptional regulator for hemolysin|uniref:MarR family winged helix-turn-helix transcriptional regulator n=1 Tax=Rhizobium/Agrobacterium group TaxID=227290 RepID=UPI000715663D|nr:MULTISPECIES: MarR family transcriptional regulator [Rhizobium/Agrobacterium group]KQY19357.1 MarR family transcriptional regulator [Rhizobium sp. Root483D2]
MPNSAVNRELFDALASVNRKLRALFDARVKARGLTLSRARALFALSKRDGLNQRELADELGIETPTIVRLLDGMEKQGFIERRVEASDRRAKQIHMTARGRNIAGEIDKLACEIREQVLGGVDNKDKAIALQVVSLMAGNLVSIGRD